MTGETRSPPRRVVVTLELDSALSLDELRSLGAWDQAIQATFFGSADTTVLQVQANVIRPKQRARRRWKKPVARKVLRARTRSKKKKKVTRLGRKVRGR